jgi:hypothetical protein
LLITRLAASPYLQFQLSDAIKANDQNTIRKIFFDFQRDQAFRHDQVDAMMSTYTQDDLKTILQTSRDVQTLMREVQNNIFLSPDIQERFQDKEDVIRLAEHAERFPVTGDLMALHASWHAQRFVIRLQDALDTYPYKLNIIFDTLLDNPHLTIRLEALLHLPLTADKKQLVSNYMNKTRNDMSLMKIFDEAVEKRYLGVISYISEHISGRIWFYNHKIRAIRNGDVELLLTFCQNESIDVLVHTLSMAVMLRQHHIMNMLMTRIRQRIGPQECLENYLEPAIAVAREVTQELRSDPSNEREIFIEVSNGDIMMMEISEELKVIQSYPNLRDHC